MAKILEGIVATVLRGDVSSRSMLAPSRIGSFVNLTVAVQLDAAGRLASCKAQHLAPGGFTVKDADAKSTAVLTADGKFHAVTVYIAVQM